MHALQGARECCYTNCGGEETMKYVITVFMALLIAAPVYAETSARDGSDAPVIPGSGYQMLRDASDVLIYQVREANEAFGDMIPFYEAALAGAGANVSAIDAPSGGGAFPGDFDPESYPCTFIVTSENFQAPNFTPGDEATCTEYLEMGGAIYFSGQDYLYGAGYPDGAAYGFPAMLGAGNIAQDTPFGADPMTVQGSELFAGLTLQLDSTVCFISNPFYPDTIEPGAGAMTLWTQTAPENHNGAVINDQEVYRTIFTTLELAGDTTQQFDGVIGASYEWLIGGGVATENVSLSEMKALYR